MNRFLYFSAIAVMATSMACSQQRAADNRSDSTGSASSEGASTSQDSAMGNNDAAANNAASEMNQAAKAGNSDAQQGDMGQLQGMDKEFAMKAAQGGMAEVQIAKLAQEKAQNPQVKQFAQQLEKDHTMANQKLMQVISAKGGSAPTELDSEHKQMVDQVSGMSGAEFDKAFMDMQVQHHQEDVNQFKQASQSAQDQQVKQFAAQTLPKLQQHLQKAQQIQKQVNKGGAQSASNQKSMNQ